MKIYDTIIVGAGPAGLTSAIYLRRAEIDVLVIEKLMPGGKVAKTSDVENYTGFKKVTGMELATDMYSHAMNYKTQFKFEEVINIEKNKDKIFSVKTKKNEYFAKSLIIASGTVERRLGVKGEDEYDGKGVSYCAVCDGALYKQKPVAVVGGGYSAIEESMYLTKFVKKVYLIHRRQGFRVPDSVLETAKKNPKIEFILDSVVEEIKGKNNLVTSLKIKNTVLDKTQEIEVAAVFPYIGANPINHFLNKYLGKITDKEGYIIKDSKCKTKLEGLFVAGDVSNTSLRQIATAVSDGAIAAQFAISFINNV